jgi:hypothetical protein
MRKVVVAIQRMVCQLWQPEAERGHLDEFNADGGVLGDRELSKSGAFACSVIP